MGSVTQPFFDSVNFSGILADLTMLGCAILVTLLIVAGAAVISGVLKIDFERKVSDEDAWFELNGVEKRDREGFSEWAEKRAKKERWNALYRDSGGRNGF
jgi:hypothetical protein